MKKTNKKQQSLFDLITLYFKVSEANKVKPSWIKGKHHSEESRKKMSESKNGSYFFNNGVKSIRAKECPGPEWKRGRIKKKNSGN